MSKIAEQAETDAFEMGLHEQTQYENDETDMTNAICDAACTTARDIGASAVITITARLVSKFRPPQPIIAATPEVKTFHQLALSWGVYPVIALFKEDEDAMFCHAADCAKMTGLVSAGDRVVITAGERSATALRIRAV